MRWIRPGGWKILAALPAILLPEIAGAEAYFQNNNLPCQAEPVLCASYAGSLVCSGPELKSVACRHVARGGGFTSADFNGDGFADCVALRDIDFDSQSAEPTASVLINLGPSAGTCTATPGRFGVSQDYVLSGAGTATRLSNAIAGKLDTGNSNFAVFDATGGASAVIAHNPGTSFGPDDGSLATSDVNAAIGFQPGIETNLGERNAALLDCDGDDRLDSAYLVEQFPVPDSQDPTVPSLQINILRNDGSGLQPILGSDTYSTNIAPDSSDHAFLTVADFNGDGSLDIAVGADIRNADISLAQVVTVCLNNGTCGFTCPATPSWNLRALHPGQDVRPASIESGDFDGDGFADLVVSEPGLSGKETRGLQYYFGDGAGFPRNRFADYAPFDGVDVAVLTTGCFNNDNVTDVAVTDQDRESLFNNIGIFPSNSDTIIGASQSLFPETRFIRGIDSADFDHAGGDDLIALAGDGENSKAFVFLNALEDVVAEAGPNQLAARETPLGLTGASCAVTPENALDPARFAVNWTILSAPPGATPSLSDAADLTPAFQADRPGDYLLQLQCRTRCTATAVDTKTVTIPGAGATPVPSPSPVPAGSPTPNPSPAPLQFAQGGCLANLHPFAGTATPSAWWVALPLLYGWMRRRLK